MLFLNFKKSEAQHLLSIILSRFHEYISLERALITVSSPVNYKIRKAIAAAASASASA